MQRLRWFKARSWSLLSTLIAVTAASLIQAAPAWAALTTLSNLAPPLATAAAATPDRDQAALPHRYQHRAVHASAATAPSQTSTAMTAICNATGEPWSPYPSPSIQGDSWLNSVAGTSSVDVWAVGASQQANASMRTLIEHFD